MAQRMNAFMRTQHFSSFSMAPPLSSSAPTPFLRPSVQQPAQMPAHAPCLRRVQTIFLSAPKSPPQTNPRLIPDLYPAPQMPPPFSFMPSPASRPPLRRHPVFRVERGTYIPTTPFLPHSVEPVNPVNSRFQQVFDRTLRTSPSEIASSLSPLGEKKRRIDSPFSDESFEEVILTPPSTFSPLFSAMLNEEERRFGVGMSSSAVPPMPSSSPTSVAPPFSTSTCLSAEVGSLDPLQPPLAGNIPFDDLFGFFPSQASNSFSPMDSLHLGFEQHQSRQENTPSRAFPSFEEMNLEGGMESLGSSCAAFPAPLTGDGSSSSPIVIDEDCVPFASEGRRPNPAKQDSSSLPALEEISCPEVEFPDPFLPQVGGSAS